MHYVVAVSQLDLPRLYVFASSDGSISPGERVIVPFRRGKTVGYVVSDLETFQVSFQQLVNKLDTTTETKEIVDRLDYESYLETWRIGALLKTALKFGGGFGRYFDLCFPPRLDDYFELIVESSSPLLNIERMPYGRFRRLPRFKDYVNAGLVTIRRDFSRRSPRPRERLYAELLLPPSHLRNVRLTANQMKVVNYLLIHGSSEVTELTESLGIKRDVLVQLRNKGVLELSATLGSERRSTSKVCLSDEQRVAVHDILSSVESSLLYGPTGCGKTEVYLEVMERYLGVGSVLYLVPEVSLTDQVLAKVRARFPDLPVAIYHSYLSEVKRVEVWARAVAGEIKVLIGPRSSLFVPMKNLALVVVDEEHDESFYNESEPHYQVHEVLRHFPVKVVYGSATPSLTLLHRARETLEVSMHVLTKRFSGASPNVRVVDVRTERMVTPSISETLFNYASEALSKDGAVLVFSRRKGFSRLQCAVCGYIVKCPRCDVSLTLHLEKSQLKCHMCGFSSELSNVCPSCGGRMFFDLGTGTEKVEAEFRRLFPARSVGRLDAESAERPEQVWEKLTQLRDGRLDVLVGTKMVTKGLDIPRIKLVGVVDIDGLLSYPDPDAPLRTFQLLVQVVGRSGRQEPGDAILQTYNPNHPVLQYACSGAVLNYYDYELKVRKELNYPPFADMVEITYGNPDPENARETIQAFLDDLRSSVTNERGLFEILGPVEHPIFKARDQYRFQAFVKVRNSEHLMGLVSELTLRYPGEWTVMVKFI